MLKWALIFLVISLVAGALGFTGVASGAAQIAKILFFIFLVLFVLPQILLVGGKLVDKTSFSMHHVVLHTNTASGRVRVNGMVQGEVNGSVAGTMNAVVDGNVHLTVLSGKISQEVQDENDSHADE